MKGRLGKDLGIVRCVSGRSSCALSIAALILVLVWFLYEWVDDDAYEVLESQTAAPVLISQNLFRLRGAHPVVPFQPYAPAFRKWKLFRMTPPRSANASDPTCVEWRTTSSCSPEGRDRVNGRKDCHAAIPKGKAGYCLCAGGVQVGGRGCKKVDYPTCSALCHAALAANVS